MTQQQDQVSTRLDSRINLRETMRQIPREDMQVTHGYLDYSVCAVR